MGHCWAASEDQVSSDLQVHVVWSNLTLMQEGKGQIEPGFAPGTVLQIFKKPGNLEICGHENRILPRFF